MFRATGELEEQQDRARSRKIERDTVSRIEKGEREPSDLFADTGLMDATVETYYR